MASITDIDWDAWFPKPERNDDANAKRWRGALFWNFDPVLQWKGKEYYECLQSPKSVTFPICEACNHVIWEWPHFEEPVPENAICEACAKEIEEDEARENDHWG